MGDFRYINKNYGIDARIGRLIRYIGDLGVIIEDRGIYLGVNFLGTRRGLIVNVHPTYEVEYLDQVVEISKISKYEKSYNFYLTHFGKFKDFGDFCVNGYYELNYIK